MLGGGSTGEINAEIKAKINSEIKAEINTEINAEINAEASERHTLILNLWGRRPQDLPRLPAVLMPRAAPPARPLPAASRPAIGARGAARLRAWRLAETRVWPVQRLLLGTYQETQSLALRLPPREYGGVQLESFIAVLETRKISTPPGGDQGGGQGSGQGGSQGGRQEGGREGGQGGGQGGGYDGYGAGEAKLRPSGPGQLVDAPAVSRDSSELRNARTPIG